jgi:uncharacterized protein (DUF305 family)
MSRACKIMVLAACVLVLAACSGAEEQPARTAGEGAPIVQLGAPGERNRVLTPEEASELPVPSFTQADVEFVQMMMTHHAQALEMTAMVDSRTTSADLPLLAKRMDVSQRDEIAMMQQWLEERDQSTTISHEHAQMPGLLTPEQITQLSEAEGAEFDQLFLQSMIYHHEGALVMVEDLLTGGEGAQETQIFQIAQHIDSDQRVEISRMKQLLAERAAG